MQCWHLLFDCYFLYYNLDRAHLYLYISSERNGDIDEVYRSIVATLHIEDNYSIW